MVVRSPRGWGGGWGTVLPGVGKDKGGVVPTPERFGNALPHRDSDVVGIVTPLESYCVDLTVPIPWGKDKKVRRHSDKFRLTLNEDFAGCLRICMEHHLERGSTWIDERLVHVLHRMLVERHPNVFPMAFELWEADSEGVRCHGSYEHSWTAPPPGGGGFGVTQLVCLMLRRFILHCDSDQAHAPPVGTVWVHLVAAKGVHCHRTAFCSGFVALQPCALRGTVGHLHLHPTGGVFLRSGISWGFGSPPAPLWKTAPWGRFKGI